MALAKVSLVSLGAQPCMRCQIYCWQGSPRLCTQTEHVAITVFAVVAAVTGAAVGRP